jgi:hypothetical protein
MGGKAVISHVLEVLAERQGLNTDINLIMKRTGLERKQIQNAISGARANGVSIDVIVRGSVYRYNDEAVLGVLENDAESPDLGNEEEIKDIFVRVGWMDDETPILKAEDGTHWRATQL